MDEASKDYTEKVQTWLSVTCKVHPAIALQLATELVTSCGVTDIAQFQVLREADSHWLDGLQCKLSTITKILINSCVEKIGRVPLQTLTVDEVSQVVSSCFSDFPYSQMFKENTINGFNLLYVQDVDALMQFGISHPVHAATLLASIKEWRRVGVPTSYLSLSDEEQNRRIMNIKQEHAIKNLLQSSSSSASGADTSSASTVHGAAHAPPRTIATAAASKSASPTVALGPLAASEERVITEPTQVEPVAQSQQSPDADEHSICSDSDPSIISAPCRPDAHLPGASAQKPLILDSSIEEEGSEGSEGRESSDRSGSGSMTSSSDDEAEDSASDSWSEIFEEEDQEATPGRVGAVPSSSERRKRGRIALEFDEESDTNDSDLPRTRRRGPPPAPAASQSKKAKLRYRRSDPTVVPTHALLSGDLLAQLSSASSAAFSVGAHQPNVRQHNDGPEVARAGTGNTAAYPARDQTAFAESTRDHSAENEAPLHAGDMAPVDHSAGVWEYRTGISPEGKDRRLLVFVPHSSPTSTSRRQLQLQGDQRLPQQELDLHSAALLSHLASGPADSAAATAAARSAGMLPEEEFLTMEMDISLVAEELDGHPADMANEDHDDNMAGYDSFDSQGHAWQDFGPDEDGGDGEGQQDLAGFDADAAFPDVITVHSSSSEVGNKASTMAALTTSAVSAAAAPAAGSDGINGSAAGSSSRSSSSRPRRLSAQRAPPQSPEQPPTRPRRNVVSPSSTSAPPRPRSLRGGRWPAGRAGTLEPVPRTLPPGLRVSFKVMCAECIQLLHNTDEKVLMHAVNQIGISIAKPSRVFVEHVLNCGAYVKLLSFVREEATFSPNFVYHVLRTISLLITKLESFTEIHIIFQRRRFQDVLQACQSKDEFVRQQALHLVSELGVNQDHDMKRSVLSAGAIAAVVKSYNTAVQFPLAKMVRVRSHCCTALFKLASTCTPAQFAHFRDAMPVLQDLLTAEYVAWDDVCDVLQALSHLVQAAAQLPEGLNAFFSKPYRLFEAAVGILQGVQERNEVRWSACTFVWSVAQHCAPSQVRHLLKLTGILGQVYLDEGADSHVRAGALNTLQVLLQQGEIFVEQFVHHRGAFAGNVMERVRTYAYQELVHEGGRDVNCIMKYASFTLTNAIIHGNKEQLVRLLDMGVYPLLFKIISLEGEDDKPEEGKLKAVQALRRLLSVCPEAVSDQQQRAVKRRFDAQAAWDTVRDLLHDTAVTTTAGAAASATPTSPAKHGAASSSKSRASARVRNHGDGRGEGGDGLQLRWSKDLRDCVAEVIATAQEVGLA